MSHPWVEPCPEPRHCVRVSGGAQWSFRRRGVRCSQRAPAPGALPPSGCELSPLPASQCSQTFGGTCRRLARVSGHRGGHSPREGAQVKKGGPLAPAATGSRVPPRRCDESCLSCEGSSRNCSRCKAGFTQLGASCVANHTCSNGELQLHDGGTASGPRGKRRKTGEGSPGPPSADRHGSPLAFLPSREASHVDQTHIPATPQLLRLGLSSDS